MSSLILEPDRLEDPGFGREIDDLVVSRSRERTIARLRAYTGGYPARIGESLRESFPALAHVLGAGGFDALVRRYLPHAPAGIYNLNDVGGGLAAFLCTDVAGRELPFAPDLARLEWAVQRAFHAREKELLDPASTAGWTLEDWSAAVLELQPSVAVVRSSWPIRDVWAARDTPVEEIDIETEGRADRVLVHRAGYRVACESIDDDEANAIEALCRGVTLGEVAEDLAEGGADPNAVARWFSLWSARGLIAGCTRHGD
jgi:hypothetical protein